MYTAFLQAILDAPDYDALRLIYADYLEERGDSDQAEFIRLQCIGGHADRERELLDKHWQEWAKPIMALLIEPQRQDIIFKRGFPYCVTLRFLERFSIALHRNIYVGTNLVYPFA